jgi:hypothetical protein
VRMTPAAAASVAAHLDHLVTDLPAGRRTDPVHHVLVGVYRSG